LAYFASLDKMAAQDKTQLGYTNRIWALSPSESGLSSCETPIGYPGITISNADDVASVIGER
jgi:hypothetical protein